MARPGIALLAALLALGALARADDKPAKAPEKAPSPGHAVIMLKAAWEAGDLDAVVARYAEPGASYVRSDLAALRRAEQATQELKAAVRDRLGPAAAEKLVPPDKRMSSPLANASLTLLSQRIQGDRASTRFRVATHEGERFFRFAHVQAPDGDWKIVLSSIDGIPFDEAALRRLGAGTDAHERAARELRAVASDVRSGALTGKDAVRKAIGKVLARERDAIETGQESERRDDGHEND